MPDPLSWDCEVELPAELAHALRQRRVMKTGVHPRLRRGKLFLKMLCPSPQGDRAGDQHRGQEGPEIQPGLAGMGVLRDLKKATEAYWGGKLSRDDLLAEGKRLRLKHWQIQKDAGVDIIPSNDFAFYDQVLDHIELFGVRFVSPNGARV